MMLSTISKRIVEAMNADLRVDCLERDYAYVKLIKDKVQSLANEYAAKKFGNCWPLRESSFVRHSHCRQRLHQVKMLLLSAKAFMSLKAVWITWKAKLSVVLQNWKTLSGWHRNLERGKGFLLNGFLNHYPDFIVLTERKNIIVVETKGDDRDNSDSKDKLKLGKIWESQANQIAHETGYRYHYMMVFESNPIDGAHTTGDVLKLIEALWFERIENRKHLRVLFQTSKGELDEDFCKILRTAMALVN